MEVAELKQICIACPSAWEGKLKDGCELYVKYRYGCLRIDVDGKTIHEEQLSDGLDGWLKQKRLLEIMVKQGFNIDEMPDVDL